MYFLYGDGMVGIGRLVGGNLWKRVFLLYLELVCVDKVLLLCFLVFGFFCKEYLFFE